MADRSSGRPAIGLVAPRIPYHALVLAGISTAGFTAALAGVVGLQASEEARQIAERAPQVDRVAALADRGDRLARRISALDEAQKAVASDYDGVASGLPALDAALGNLARSVKTIDGASKALPRSVALPPVVRSVRSTPIGTRAHVTTGGSAAP
jgi:hypothetical protein